MTADEILMDTEERMEKAVSVFRDDLRGLRTGRATPALVDSLRVEYYGSDTPLKQLAQISTPDPQSIVIKPFDPSVLKEIEKAIRASNLGMTPNNDGKLIRLIVPPMSGENRKKLASVIKKSAESAKVACRNIRRDLRVMDTQAISTCREGKVPILIFNFKRQGNIERAIAGHALGTLVKESF